MNNNIIHSHLIKTHLKIIPQVNFLLRKKYSFYFREVHVHLRKIGIANKQKTRELVPENLLSCHPGITS